MIFSLKIGAPSRLSVNLFEKKDDVTAPRLIVVRQTVVVPVEQWIPACSATKSFCPSSEEGMGSEAPEDLNSGLGKNRHHHAGLSNAVAGVIGALVTLAVVLIAGLAFWLVRRRKLAKTPEMAAPLRKKSSLDTGSS